MKKYLLDLAFGGILVTLLVALSLPLISANFTPPQPNGNHRHRFKNTEEQTVCHSAACVSRSAAAVSAMDPSVDPCQDFYQYACGRWTRNFSSTIMRKYGWRVSGVAGTDNYVRLQKILEKRDAESSEAGKHAIRYYESCLQTKKTRITDDTHSRKSLLQLLDLIGGWSVIDKISKKNNLRTSWNFQEIFEIIHNVFRVDVFFRWEVTKLSKKPNWNYTNEPYQPTIHVHHHINEIITSLRPGSPSDLISEMREVASFLLKDNVTTFTNRNQLLLAETVEDIMDVNSKIYRIFPDSAWNGSISATIAKLQMYAPFIFTGKQHVLHILDKPDFVLEIDWNKFFQSAFSQVNITITPSRSVVVSSLSFLQNISTFVKELLVTERGQSKLKNYLSWQVAKSHFAALKTRWNNPAAIKKGENVYDDCVDITVEQLDLAVSSMFLRRSVDSESKKHLAETMAKSVQEAFKDTVNQLDWLDDQTRKGIREKVDAITNQIGYPEFILNTTKLDKFYSGLEMKSDEYLMNNIRLKRFNFRKQLSALDRHTDKSKWDLNVFSTGFFFLVASNTVILQSGALHELFFDVTFPPAFNFGTVGYGIGHEIAHGFTDIGLLYDSNGHKRQWLNNATNQRLQKSSKCFIDQYSNYSIDGYTIDGRKTLWENLADNVGLIIAYKAFINWTKSTHKMEYLPLPSELTLTHEQQFFLSFAQKLCSNVMAANPLETHSPSRYRVIGTLSNMPEFSSSFQCPTESSMNPKLKCRIW